MAKKSRAELEAELKFIKKSTVADGFVKVLTTLIQWGGISYIFFIIFRCVEVLAGKMTLADIGVSVLGEMNVSVALSWGVGISGIWYGRKQRRLRKDAIERLQGRIKKLESDIDPNRTSSQLTPRGDTNIEDRE